VLIKLTILFLLFPEWGTYFNLATWADPHVADYTLTSGLLIALVACFLGALVPFPVPYTVIIGIIAYQFNLKGFHWYSIVLMILVASISNITGDSLDWILGRGGTYFAEKSEQKEKINRTENDAEKKNDVEASKVEQNRWEKLIYKRPRLLPFLLV
jgi:membrane protein YqaA with SNARE-associated domain